MGGIIVRAVPGIVDLYTGQTGLPYFDRAAVIAIGSWYYGRALEPMRGNQSFRCHLVNIRPIYKQ